MYDNFSKWTKAKRVEIDFLFERLKEGENGIETYVILMDTLGIEDPQIAMNLLREMSEDNEISKRKMEDVLWILTGTKGTKKRCELCFRCCCNDQKQVKVETILSLARMTLGRNAAIELQESLVDAFILNIIDDYRNGIRKPMGTHATLMVKKEDFLNEQDFNTLLTNHLPGVLSNFCIDLNTVPAC